MSRSSTSAAELNLDLHPQQRVALHSQATEILYGGAAGGGKSFLMRSCAILWCAEIAGLQVYLFRRTEGDLTKNHIEGPSGFRSLLAGWVQCGFVQIVDGEIRFWNGSKIFLCHCKDEKHRFNYLGAEIHVLMMDELTTFTETIYRFLRGRVRAVGLPKLPEKYRGLFPRILSSSNPGNIGHLWVKAAFIDGAAPLEVRQMSDDEGGMMRQYIPARLADNPSMERDDPNYRQRLRGLGSEALVKAMEDGDWNVIDGAYFDNWSEDNVIVPFTIPEDWTRFRAMDWGSAKPFSVGWYAVASENTQTPSGWIPRGALIKYREWYGAKKGADGKSVPNVGLKLFAEEVAAGIKERDGMEKISYGVLDPAAFAHDGGESIYDRMARKAVYFRAADNARIAARGAMGGWDQLRSRISGEDFGFPLGKRPMLFFFNTCYDSIRTIPALMHDSARPEDLDSDMEDHAADETRYACMSRPYIAAERKNEQKRTDAWGRPKPAKSDWMTA